MVVTGEMEVLVGSSCRCVFVCARHPLNPKFCYYTSLAVLTEKPRTRSGAHNPVATQRER